jgi:hypothetical protein
MRGWGRALIAEDARGNDMPEMETLERARKDAAEGKSSSTQAGEFVREEIDHVREAKHGVRSAKQAIAIGLSKARRAGVKLPPPRGSAATRRKAAQDTRAAKSKRKPSTTRSRATESALRRESRRGASRSALSKQAKEAAASSGPQSRKTAAPKAARTRQAAKYCQGFTDRCSATNREICDVFRLTSAVLSFLSPVKSLRGGRTFSHGSHAS